MNKQMPLNEALKIPRDIRENFAADAVIHDEVSVKDACKFYRVLEAPVVKKVLFYD